MLMMRITVVAFSRNSIEEKGGIAWQEPCGTGAKVKLDIPIEKDTEDQLGALGLVINVIVLWNTLYMNAALTYLQEQELQIEPEEIARLSLLGYAHINMLGRYHFELSEALLKGEMRPLRNLSQSSVFENWGRLEEP